VLGIPWRVAAQLITFVLPGLLIIDCDCPQAKQEELVYLASDVQAAQSEAGSLRKQLSSMGTQLEAASAKISQQQRDMAAMEEVKKQLQASNIIFDCHDATLPFCVIPYPACRGTVALVNATRMVD